MTEHERSPVSEETVEIVRQAIKREYDRMPGARLTPIDIERFGPRRHRCDAWVAQHGNRPAAD